MITTRNYSAYFRQSTEHQSAEADRGRHPGFPSFNVLADGPGSLAER